MQLLGKGREGIGWGGSMNFSRGKGGGRRYKDGKPERGGDQ